MKKTIFVLAMAVACLTQVKAQMPTASVDVSPLLVGETIPDGTLVGAQGNTVFISSIIKEKPTMIIFYRGEWCSNCTRHFNEEIVPHLADIERLGYNLIAICPDAPQGLMATSEASGLPAKYLYGDGSGDFVKGMGLAFKQQERMYERLMTSSGGKNTDYYLPVPALYVIDTDMKVQFAHITPAAIPNKDRIKWQLIGPVLQALK